MKCIDCGKDAVLIYTGIGADERIHFAFCKECFKKRYIAPREVKGRIIPWESCFGFRIIDLWKDLCGDLPGFNKDMEG